MENDFNCSRFVPQRCNAFCCGSLPIKKEVYYAHYFNRKRDVIREVDLGDEIFPETEDRICTFLDDTFRCMIYEDRPQLCRDFGKLDHPLGRCPFMDKYGVQRTEKEQHRIVKKLNEEVEKMRQNDSSDLGHSIL